MKTLIKILICLLSFNSFAQTSPLEDHTWYLEKLVIDGNDFPPASAYQNNYTAIFSNSADFLLSAPCYPIDGILTYSQNQTFVINDSSFPLDCDGLPQQVVEYDEKIVYELISSINISPNPFSYTFSNQPNYIVLTITNANGDQAIYRSQQLAIGSKAKVEVNLYPNAVTNNFQLEIETGKEIKTVRIFSVNGKEVLSFIEAQSSYDVSQLSSGIYFVNIESKTGQSMKKMLKQ